MRQKGLLNKFKTDYEQRRYKKIINCWRIHKHYCYSKKANRYYCYGALGWKFCEEWSPNNEYGLINFYKWAIKFITTEEDLKLFLDKDYNDNGLKLMRPESCRWVTPSESTKERNSRHVEEQREYVKIALAHNPYKKGVPRTKKMIEHLKKRKTCPYCGKSFDLLNYNRWHGDNCKLKP